MRRDDLVRYLDERLATAQIEDHSVNGLQVQGREEVQRVALATDAALATYRLAIAAGCEMLIVHHGLIWGGLRAITGRDHDHVKILLDHGLNLYASHLPLDVHPELGHAAQLARIAGLTQTTPFGRYGRLDVGVQGALPEPVPLPVLVERWRFALGGEPVVAQFGKAEVRTVAVASGSASSTLPEAIAKGIDCLATGEGRHQDHHLALEAGINLVYLGHYRSETPGLRALGRELEERLGLQTTFVDAPTILG